jgi:hypothetical protein
MGLLYSSNQPCWFGHISALTSQIEVPLWWDIPPSTVAPPLRCAAQGMNGSCSLRRRTPNTGNGSTDDYTPELSIKSNNYIVPYRIQIPLLLLVRYNVGKFHIWPRYTQLYEIPGFKPQFRCRLLKIPPPQIPSKHLLSSFRPSYQMIIYKQTNKHIGLSLWANFCRWMVVCDQPNGSPWPHSRISTPKPLLFLPSSSSIVLAWLSAPHYRPTTSQKIGSTGNRTQTTQVANNSVPLSAVEQTLWCSSSPDSNFFWTNKQFQSTYIN